MQPQSAFASTAPLGADELLAEINQATSAELQPNTGPRGGRYLATGGKRPEPKMRYTHQGMADLLIAEPATSQAELAAIFGYSQAWISTILHSDAFQTLLATRRAEVMNPELALTLRERANGLTAKSMQVLMEKLNAPVVSDQLALRAFELGAKAVGMGGNATPPAPPNPAEYLPAVAERLMRLQGRVTGEVVDVESKGVSA